MNSVSKRTDFKKVCLSQPISARQVHSGPLEPQLVISRSERPY